jgi:O-glycosyl hydrolase
MWKHSYCVVVFSALFFGAALVRANVEVEGWGDLRGFRIDGQLFAISTSLRIVGPEGRPTFGTGHWQQRDLQFSRAGDMQAYSGRFGPRRGSLGFTYTTTVEPLDDNRARIHVNVVSQQDANLDGVFFSVSVPLADFSGAEADLIGLEAPATRTSEIATTQPAVGRGYLHNTAAGVSLATNNRKLQVDFDMPRDARIRDVHDPHGDQVNCLIQLRSGAVKKGEAIEGTFVITMTGDVDHQPAHVAIDSASLGSPFDGLGGNFVFKLDTPDVPFNLQHLHIVMARMAVPLIQWEPTETATADLSTLAVNDTPKSDIRQSLALAKQFEQQGIPLIFTLWVSPPWALTVPPTGDLYTEGRQVKPDKWDELAEGLASYLLYAREKYGVEPKYFSLNETDIGVTIRLTPKQYDNAIKRIGACFAARGLTTKILLGDVSKPPPVDFIKVASADPDAMKYVGAVSFHSWNGATAAQLAAWHQAAEKLELPLFVAEGGTDSDAYKYPHVFTYPWYAMDEAAMYVDTLADAQPAAMLPWEMTPDYGLETFVGNNAQPSKRFWCLKQLSDGIAPGSSEMGLTSDQPAIHAAALLDPSKAGCSIHLVNMGASREVTVSGIPSGVETLETYLTDSTHEFTRGPAVAVKDGTAELNLPGLSFVTLTSRPVASANGQ